MSDGCRQSSPTAWSRVGQRLARPVQIVERTRWLFWVLAMASLGLVCVPVLASASGGAWWLGAASGAGLAVSVTTCYLSRRTRWPLDVLDAGLLVGLATAAPAPQVVLAFVFADIWFRCLYGSTVTAVLRLVLTGTALSGTVVLWSRVPGNTEALSPSALLGILPTMLLTVVVGRHLSGIVGDRHAAARRNAILADLGTELLAIKEPSTILDAACRAMDGICAATPGLRVARVVDDGGPVVRIAKHAGHFAVVPTELPTQLPTELPTELPRRDIPLVQARNGVVAAGVPWPEIDPGRRPECRWWRIPSFDGEQSWQVVGYPGRLPVQALDAVTSVVTQVTLAMRNSTAHHELTRQATVDPLTGLANRSLFQASLTTALTDTSSKGTSVLFVDLDDFKDVNDVYGHAAGDDALRAVADRLRHATRADDVCARLGGDEFAVLLPDTDARAATVVAERVVQAVAKPVALARGAARVGASVGLAVADRDVSAEQVLQRADIAMYAAKAAGKGRLQPFSPELLQGDALQAALDRQLLAATGNHEMVVQYQPVVSLDTGRCVALEALVRWRHPERGMLPPSEFVTAAERTGAIRDIGLFVLRQACSDLSAWQQSGRTGRLAVHVNVSALQLDEDFCTQVLACLEEFRVSPDQLVLEITETVVISSDAAIGLLNRLAEHGVAIAIDDFGTGYSALTSLRALPVRIVKIDKSFVAGSTANADDRAVTEAVVQMASRMGLLTIAEGVERPEQQALLATIGVDAAQGYLYRRPATASEIAVWLDGNHANRPGDRPTPDGVVALRPRRSAAS